MKEEEEFGPIEQEIIKEETQKSAGERSKFLPKIQTAKVKASILNILRGVRRPKIITLIILFGIGLLVYLGLTLMTTRQEKEETKPSTQETPTVPSATSDASLTNIAQKVEAYGQKIDSLDNFQKKLAKPIVDLAIDFKGE